VCQGTSTQCRIYVVECHEAQVWWGAQFKRCKNSIAGYLSAQTAQENYQSQNRTQGPQSRLGGGGATRPPPKDGSVEELHRDPTVGPRPKSGPEVKNGRSCAEDSAGEVRMRDSQRGGKSDSAEGVRWRCMKNSPPVLSCIGKRTKEGCGRGSVV